MLAAQMLRAIETCGDGLWDWVGRTARRATRDASGSSLPTEAGWSGRRLQSIDILVNVG